MQGASLGRGPLPSSEPTAGGSLMAEGTRGTNVRLPHHADSTNRKHVVLSPGAEKALYKTQASFTMKTPELGVRPPHVAEAVCEPLAATLVGEGVRTSVQGQEHGTCCSNVSSPSSRGSGRSSWTRERIAETPGRKPQGPRVHSHTGLRAGNSKDDDGGDSR